MRTIEWRKVILNILITLVMSLLVSNIIIYREYKEMKRKTNYASNLSTTISIAANSDEMLLLKLKLNPKDIDYLLETFETIKPVIGSRYNIRNYIAIRYDNGNILMLKVTRSEEGEFLIQDMFLLDEDIYDKLKYDTEYSNLYF